MGAAGRQLSAVLLTALLAASCAVQRELSQVEPINLSDGTITGVVTDSVSGRALVGAAVRLLQPSGEPVTGQQDMTYAYAPDGRYWFGSVRPGSYLLRASFGGHDSLTVAVDDVKAGERRSIAMPLRPRAP